MGFDRILKFLVPKDKVFHPLFEKGAQNMVLTATTLKKLMGAYEVENKDGIIAQIKELENKGDDVTHQVYDLLNTAFITPFDREDIQLLASTMDDVVDYMNSSADRIKRYRPKAYMPEFLILADMLVTIAGLVESAIQELKDVKNPEKIREYCLKIDTLENQADDVYHNGLSNLFDKEKDSTELIKKKEILEALERAIDHAEDVSDVMKTIIIKMA